jgi:3-isopropylmalate dehydratase small subunit
MKGVMERQRRRLCLLDGVDDLGYIQKQDEAISSYESKAKY